MDKYTLRFQNSILEAKYRKGQYELLTPYFYLSQTIFALAILLFLFYGAFIVFSLRGILLCCFQLILIIMGTKAGRDYPQYRQIIALLENFVLSLNQLFYVTQVQTFTDGVSELYLIPHQSYMSGYFVGGMNASTIVGPDFLHNFVGLTILVLVKFLIGMISDFSTISLAIPIVGILMIHTCYYKELNNRLSFLGQQRQTGLELLLHQGFQESLIQCSINEQDCQIELKLSNKQFQDHYQVFDDHSMRLLFRNIKVVGSVQRKKDLEQWIWFHANKNEKKDSISEYFIHCEFDQDSYQKKFSIKVIFQLIDQRICNLFFQSEVDLKLIQQDFEDGQVINSQPNQIQRQNISKSLLSLSKVIIKRYGQYDRFLKNKLQLYCLKICNLIHIENLQSNSLLSMYRISTQEFTKILMQSQKIFMDSQAKYEIFDLQQTQFGTSLQLSIHLHLKILIWLKKHKIILLKVQLSCSKIKQKPLFELNYIVDSSVKKEQFEKLKLQVKSIIQQIGIIDTFRLELFGRSFSICLFDFLNLYV